MNETIRGTDAGSGITSELEVVRTALISEYDVLEELGRGGMAIVYRAHDRQLDREVALKVLPRNLLHDTALVERFQREGRIATPPDPTSESGCGATIRSTSPEASLARASS